LTKKIRLILTILMVYISIAGLVTFSLFIHEEAIQTTMFGTWPAKNAKQWHIVLEGMDLMAKINISAKVLNYSIGWIQPLAFFSYRAYSKATDFYIKGIQSECFAHAPQLFVGRHIEFKFYPQSSVNINGTQLLVNRNIAIISTVIPNYTPRIISGIVIKFDKYLVVQNDL